MNRLTSDDDLFLKMDRNYGSPLVNQVIWRFAQPVPRAVLERLHARLAAGALARRVEHPVVPLARPRWRRSAAHHPLAVAAAPVAPADYAAWFLRERDADLDPAQGTMWRLSAAPTTDGGMLLTLVTSHVVSDGGAVIAAVKECLAMEDAGLPADAVPPSAAWVEGAPPRFGALVADLADAAAQAAAIATGVARAARSRGTVLAKPANPRPDEPELDLPERFSPPTIIVDCPLAQWEAAAAGAGGTANGLLLGIGVGLLARSGRVAAGQDVKVAIPVSRRTDRDPRANATSGVSIAVTAAPGRRTDLTAVRGRSKAAFAALDAGPAGPMAHLAPLQMALPDVVFRRLAATSTAPVCLCTNLGTGAEDLRVLGGVRAEAMAMRPVLREGETAMFRRTQGGVNLSWCTDGDTATLCVTGIDPDRFPTEEALWRLVGQEYALWGLTAVSWSDGAAVAA